MTTKKTEKIAKKSHVITDEKATTTRARAREAKKVEKKSAENVEISCEKSAKINVKTSAKKTAKNEKLEKNSRKKSDEKIEKNFAKDFVGAIEKQVEKSIKKQNRAKQTAVLREYNRKKSIQKSDEILVEICAEIADGKSIVDVGKMAKMPDKSTIFRWMHDDKNFREMVNIAQQEGADVWADEMMDEARNSAGDIMEYYDGNKTVIRPNSANVQRSRLKIDTIKWLIIQRNPKKYGERLKVGGDTGGDPLKIEHKFAGMSDAELIAKMRETAREISEDKAGEHIDTEVYDDVSRNIEGETFEESE